MLNIFKNKKAVTLIEMLISLAITSMIILTVSSTVIRAWNLNAKFQVRTQITLDANNVLDLMSKDIQTSEKIGTCSNNSCTMYYKGSTIIWDTYTDANNKIKIRKTVDGVLKYTIPDTFTINTLNIFRITSATGSTSDTYKNSVYIKFLVNSNKTDNNFVPLVQSLVKQKLISLRNYD